MGSAVDAILPVCIRRGNGDSVRKFTSLLLPMEKKQVCKFRNSCHMQSFEAEATSSIVPVFVSSNKQPQRKILLMLCWIVKKILLLSWKVLLKNFTTHPLKLAQCPL